MLEKAQLTHSCCQREMFKVEIKKVRGNQWEGLILPSVSE
jgi:hypothetical protein